MCVGNDAVKVKVSTSGCQIVSISNTEVLDVPGEQARNPLWEPPWSTTTAALRKVAALDAKSFSQDGADTLESELLSCIGGHSLCCDVFGAHSDGEVSRSGLSFHGEAGLRTWEVTKVGQNFSFVTLSVHMHESMLRMTRTFTPCPKGAPVVKVTETVTNLVGFQRAMGRSQHVSLNVVSDSSTSFTAFNTNASSGMTWPEDIGEHSFWKIGATFNVKEGIPRKDGGKDDWFRFPRGGAPQLDLCTLNVPESEPHGWFTACIQSESDDDPKPTKDSQQVLAYLWERKAFPWLMTWEEFRGRDHQPWGGRTIVRGLEFGSYALALGRQRNVEIGTLFGTSTYEWLDAHETKETSFYMSVQRVSTSGMDTARSHLEMEEGGLVYKSASGIRIEKF